MEQSDAARLLMSADSLKDNERLVVQLGLSATAYDGDPARRLFTASGRARFGEIAGHLPSWEFSNPRDPRAYYEFETNQYALSAETFRTSPTYSHHGLERRWKVMALATGAVALRCSAPDDVIKVTPFMAGIVTPAWSAAVALARLMGGYGSARIVFSISGHMRVVPSSPTPEVREFSGRLAEIHRWINLDRDPPVPDESVASVTREFLRAAGFDEWEPESDDEASDEPR
jgi:hypothetical protein